LVDWLLVLVRAGVKPQQLGAAIPFMGALLKQEQDLERVSGAGPRSSHGWS